MLDDAQAILAEYPAAFRPTGPLEPLGNAGGLSGARLWRFTSGRGALVLRAWPPEGRGREAMELVHEWLEHAVRLEFVPQPFRALDGRSLLERGGRFWELAEWKPGAAEHAQPPSAERLRAGLRGLAAFHQCLAVHTSTGRSPGLMQRTYSLWDLSELGLNRLAKAAHTPEPRDFEALRQRWVALARPLAPRVYERVRREADEHVPLQPCLRDARGEHFLFEGERLTGLVDFGAMDIDTVAGDLARLLGDWVGDDRQARAIALESYTAVRPLSDTETRLIEVFEWAADILIGARWLEWGLYARRWFDDPAAVREGLERGVERLERLAAATLS